MSEVNHSPTPWRGLSFYGGVCVKDAKGYVVLPAGYPTIKDVGHIVKCVNSHDALTAEVERLEAENAKMREALTRIAGGESANNAFEEVAWNMVQWAKAALAAEGETK